MTSEPAPEPPPVDVTATHVAATVLGPQAVLEVCARAALILLGGALVLYVGYLALERPTAHDTVDAESAAIIVALMYGVHLAALFALGWPGGMVTAHLMRRHTSERRHVAAFGVTGAVLGAAVLLTIGSAGPASVWAVVGGVSAGGARAWTGHARHRRAARRSTHPAAT